MLYTLYAVHTVCCTHCMLYTLYAVHTVCCTHCMKYMEEMFSPIMCIHPCSLVDQDACAADQLLLSVTLGTTYGHQCGELVCEEEGGMEGRKMVEMEGKNGGVEGGGSEGGRKGEGVREEGEE